MQPCTPMRRSAHWGPSGGQARMTWRFGSHGAAGDAVDARGVDALGHGHRRRNGGEASSQHRLARPWGPQTRHVVDTCQPRLSLYFLNPEPTGEVAFALFDCSGGGRVAGEGSLDHWEF
jgi:hypothetical protein